MIMKTNIEHKWRSQSYASNCYTVYYYLENVPGLFISKTLTAKEKKATISVVNQFCYNLIVDISVI